HLLSELKRSPKLFADETRCPVLDPGRGKTKSGFLWAIARDDRPWGGTEPPAVAYRYAPGRGKEHAVALLEGFSGVLQVDGYAAYNELTRAGSAVTLAFCWSHVRRRFYEIHVGGQCADRDRGARARQQAVCDRGGDPRRRPGGAPCREAGALEVHY